MSIEDVIARSERSEQLTTLYHFSVAKSLAISKLRKFALASQSHYVLELVQAAIANGATYLDITLTQLITRLSWVGGGFTPVELQTLFDFLFASKDDLDVADVRQLALGVNALMGLGTRTIVLESGDGTLEGTMRVEIDIPNDAVTVGVPSEPLNGTFLVAHWPSPRDVNRELRLLEERCLTAPIPLLINGDFLFGYSSTRSPDLFGYRKTVKFDEGDLYGTLGLATTEFTRSIKLLTWGTWITSVTHEFDDVAIGGVVGFDRLRKTADHANIVGDHVLEEMWVRLLPYARQLISGRAVTFDVTLLSGAPVTPRQLREIGEASGRIVLFQKSDFDTPNTQWLAGRFQDALDAPVLISGSTEREYIRALASDTFHIFSPALDERHLRFLERPIAPLPPRPWLAAPLVADVAAVDFVRQVKGTARWALRDCVGLDITVYTPAAATGEGHTMVELRAEGRLIEGAAVPSPFPGHVVVVNIQGIDVTRMTEVGSGVVDDIARAALELARNELGSAADEALRSRGVQHASGTHVALAFIARHAFLRLERVDGNVELRLAMDAAGHPLNVDDHKLITMMSGEAISLNELVRRAAKTEGLVVVSRAPSIADETMRDVVVKADDAVARVLEGLFGPLSFVDFDASDGRRAVIARRELLCTLAEGVGDDLLEDEPLIPLGQGDALSMRQLRERFAQGPVAMLDGAALPFGPLTPSRTAEGPLAADLFVFHQVRKVGEVVPVLDVDLSAGYEGAMVEAIWLDEENLSGVIGFPVDACVATVIWTDEDNGLTRTVQTHHGMIGRVKTRGIDETQLHGRLRAHGHHAIRAIETRATKRQADWERALEILLDYCERQVVIVRRGDGALDLAYDDYDVDRILRLPLVTTTQGVMISIGRYLNEAVTYGDVRDRIELTVDDAAHIQPWFDKMLDVAAAPLPPRNVAYALVDVRDWLNQLLEQLRVDRQQSYQLQFRNGAHSEPFTLIGETLMAEVRAPLVEAVLSSEGAARAEAAAWLLLAAYAHINEKRGPITNDHELQFQGRVLDWLASQ